MSIRLNLLASLLIVVGALTGCGPGTVHSNVLRFHTLPATGDTRTFAVVPREAQVGSLEFSAYADMVADHLKRQGYRPAASPAQADLVVQMHYTVDDGRVEVWTTPIYSYNDYWRRYYGAAAAWPYPYNDVSGANTNSTTIYTHRVEVQIIDGKTFRAGSPQNVFEGRSVAERQTRVLVTTMPYLLEALFQGFPGRSGEPVSVRIPIEARPTR